MTLNVSRAVYDLRLQRTAWRRVVEAIRYFEQLAAARGWDIKVAATITPRDQEEPDEAA